MEKLRMFDLESVPDLGGSYREGEKKCQDLAGVTKFSGILLLLSGLLAFPSTLFVISIGRPVQMWWLTFIVPMILVAVVCCALGFIALITFVEKSMGYLLERYRLPQRPAGYDSDMADAVLKLRKDIADNNRRVEGLPELQERIEHELVRVQTYAEARDASIENLTEPL